MHLDGDAHAVIGSELAVLAPVRRDHFVPLVFENVEIVRRPGTRDPVGRSGLGRIARTTGKIDNHGHTEFFGQENSPAAHFAMLRGANWIRMKRVAVAAKCADGDAAIGERFAESIEGLRVVQHRQLAVRVTGVVASAEFDSVDVKRFELVEDGGQRKLGEQWREDSNFHA